MGNSDSREGGRTGKGERRPPMFEAANRAFDRLSGDGAQVGAEDWRVSAGKGGRVT